MNKKALVIGLALLAVAGVALAASRNLGAVGEGDGPIASPDDAAAPFDDGAAGWIDFWTNQNYTETEINTMPLPIPPNPQSNITAMLATIKQAEGTAQTGDPYRVCFGYKHSIASFADHPAVTREWLGEPLSAAMCAGAGFGPGCVSTAAGAYQIIKPTWLKLKAQLGLTDFSPASQDAAAVELLRQRGALAPLEQGRFADAVYAARKEWASLKGAGYGQGERSIEWLTARFQESGGVLA